MKVYEIPTKFELVDNKQFIWMDNDEFVCTYKLCKTNDSYQLQSLYVVEEHRNKGYAKMMMFHFIKYLSSSYIKDDIYLLVHQDNIIAKNLYKKYGFEHNNYQITEELVFEWMVRKGMNSLTGINK